MDRSVLRLDPPDGVIADGLIVGSSYSSVYTKYNIQEVTNEKFNRHLYPL